MVEGIPRNSKLIASVGETRVYSLVQRPDVQVRVWFVRTNDVTVKNMIVKMSLMHPAVFTVNVIGPDSNIIEITWQEEEIGPEVPDNDRENLHLALSNYSGGSKEISFLLQGCKVHSSLPHQLRCILGGTYQFNFPLEQTFGSVNPRRSNLTIDPAVSHARRTIVQNDEENRMFSDSTATVYVFEICKILWVFL